MSSLEALVVHLALVAGDGVAQARVVARVHHGAAHLAEARLARHQQQRRVEQRVVLAQVLLALVTAPPTTF